MADIPSAGVTRVFGVAYATGLASQFEDIKLSICSCRSGTGEQSQQVYRGTTCGASSFVARKMSSSNANSVSGALKWAAAHPFLATLSAVFLAVGAIPIVGCLVFILISVVVGLVSWIVCQVAVIVSTLLFLGFFLSIAACCSGCATSVVVSLYYACKAGGAAIGAVVGEKEARGGLEEEPSKED